MEVREFPMGFFSIHRVGLQNNERDKGLREERDKNRRNWEDKARAAYTTAMIYKGVEADVEKNYLKEHVRAVQDLEEQQRYRDNARTKIKAVNEGISAFYNAMMGNETLTTADNVWLKGLGLEQYFPMIQAAFPNWDALSLTKKLWAAAMWYQNPGHWTYGVGFGGSRVEKDFMNDPHVKKIMKDVTIKNVMNMRKAEKILRSAKGFTERRSFKDFREEGLTRPLRKKRRHGIKKRRKKRIY